MNKILEKLQHWIVVTFLRQGIDGGSKLPLHHFMVIESGPWRFGDGVVSVEAVVRVAGPLQLCK